MAIKRLAVIGLDGGTWNILRPLMERGVMPCLKEICETALTGELQSTNPYVSECAWATLQTGVGPDLHGIFHSMVLDTQDHTLIVPDSTFLADKTIWRKMSQHGLRLLLYNVPLSYPAYSCNGVMVGGLLTDNGKLRNGVTWPSQIHDTLLERFGGQSAARYNPFVSNSAYFDGGNDNLIKVASAAEKQRMTAAQWLVKRENWDVFVFHIQSVDVLQHHMWKVLTGAESGRAEVFEYYRMIDGFLAETLNETADDASLCIISDHGFCESKGVVEIETWLADEGLLQYSRSAPTKSWLLQAARKLDIFDLRRKFLGERTRLKLAASAQQMRFDLSSSKVLTLFGGTFVYINKAAVSTSSEYKQLCQHIVQGLTDIQDPESGEPVIQAVYPRAEIYPEASFSWTPDLVVVPADGYLLGWHNCGELVRDLRRDEPEGTHDNRAIFVLTGPRVSKPASELRLPLKAIPELILSLTEVRPLADLKEYPELTGTLRGAAEVL